MSMERNNCVICESTELQYLVTYYDFPIYMGARNGQSEIREDQIWNICGECGCIQLGNLIELDLLYKHSHNPAIGKTWEDHNKEFSNFILRNCSSKILEIGGGNFKVFNLLSQAEEFESYTIYDSNIYGNPPANCKVVNSFIDPNSFSIENNEYDTIILSHVFEHFYEPRDFIKLFSKLLKNGGRVIMSFPNNTNMLESGYYNGICFEHTYQIDTDFVLRMMSDFGFYLKDKYSFSQWNEFVCFEKSDNVHKFIPKNRYDSSRLIFKKFENLNISTRHLVLDSINNCKNVFLFGCHIFSQFILETSDIKFGIKGILDNDPNKIGDKLYGTDLDVLDPNVIKGLEDVLVIVKCGVYSIEISKQLKEINPNCHILL